MISGTTDIYMVSLHVRFSCVFSGDYLEEMIADISDTC